MSNYQKFAVIDYEGVFSHSSNDAYRRYAGGHFT